MSYLLQEGLWFLLPEQLAFSQLWHVRWEKSHPHELKQPAKQVNKAEASKLHLHTVGYCTNIVQLWCLAKERMHFFRIRKDRYPWLGRHAEARDTTLVGKAGLIPLLVLFTKQGYQPVHSVMFAALLLLLGRSPLMTILTCNTLQSVEQYIVSVGLECTDKDILNPPIPITSTYYLGSSSVKNSYFQLKSVGNW